MSKQHGYVLLLALLLLVGVGTGLFLAAQNNANQQLRREQANAQVLELARSALLGYAAGRQLLSTANHPGELPCPDLDNDGSDSTEASGGGCNTPAKQLGRLPWKTLGLPDLRDADGERLWYAVSANFTRSPHNTALGSDTAATINLRDASGNSLGQAIALVITPGAPLARPESISDATSYQQNRDTAGANAAKNYLDLALGEDNADFENANPGNGFITGPVRAASGETLVNDRVLSITHRDLAPLMARRVAGEVSNCLVKYSEDSNSLGRFPWMAPTALSYADEDNALTGKLPDTNQMSATCLSSGGTWSGSSCSGGMTSAWPGSCPISSLSGWWLNWKDQVSVTIAPNHRPSTVAPINSCGVAGWTTNCVNTNKQFVVTVSIPPYGNITRSAP